MARFSVYISHKHVKGAQPEAEWEMTQIPWNLSVSQAGHASHNDYIQFDVYLIYSSMYYVTAVTFL